MSLTSVRIFACRTRCGDAVRSVGSGSRRTECGLAINPRAKVALVLDGYRGIRSTHACDR